MVPKVKGIYVPLVWQIYARHGKASGRTFFPTNQQLFLTTVGSKNSWFDGKKKFAR